MGNRKRGKEGAGKGIHNNVLHANHFHTSTQATQEKLVGNKMSHVNAREGRSQGGPQPQGSARAHTKERERERKKGQGKSHGTQKREKVSTNLIRG